VGTSSERVDVPAILSRFDRLDGKNLCFWEKQSFKIAAIGSVQCGTLLALKKPTPKSWFVSANRLSELENVLIH
jgi:hypothetical protein